jgi:hypothetical protein
MAEYSNSLRVAASGTAYLVLHNGIGQTVYMTNATVWVDPALDGKFALRVVHEERKGIIVVITFYPVKRKNYGL